MTRFINQFDIKYLMVKRIVGRTKINVIDSIPYSQLIFLVASGKSYALSIAEARGKTDSSPTAKQLKQLEARGFLKSQKEKLLNKTVYSVNWKKIIEEFNTLLSTKFNEGTPVDKDGLSEAMSYVDIALDMELLKLNEHNPD